MNREEAVKYAKEYIKKKYRRQKILAYERGMSTSAVSRAVCSLSPWVLEECGLAKQVAYVPKGPK